MVRYSGEGFGDRAPVGRCSVSVKLVQNNEPEADKLAVPTRTKHPSQPIANNTLYRIVLHNCVPELYVKGNVAVFLTDIQQAALDLGALRAFGERFTSRR